MGLSESRVKQIIREELARESRLHEGFFDTVKGFFGGEDPYDHFTTKHEKWQMMKDKMDRGMNPMTFIKDLDRGIHDSKYIAPDWNKNPRDRKEYREAMKRAILDYYKTAQEKSRSKKTKDFERSRQLDKGGDRDRGSSERPESWGFERKPSKYDDPTPEDPYKFRGVDRVGAPSNPEKSYYNTSDREQIDYDDMKRLS